MSALPVISARLKARYPDARHALDWTTILAAQCTDERVNQVIGVAP